MNTFGPKKQLFMVENNQESGHMHWAICSSICSFACTAHSFAYSALLASLTRSAALICSLARSLSSLWESEWLISQHQVVLDHSIQCTSGNNAVQLRKTKWKEATKKKTEEITWNGSKKKKEKKKEGNARKRKKGNEWNERKFAKKKK